MNESLQKSMEVLCLACIVFLFFPADAQAYLDPGTGSLILQAVIGFLVGASLLIRRFWTRIKALFTRTSPPGRKEDG